MAEVGALEPALGLGAAGEPGDPAGAANRQMIQGREHARDVERLGHVDRPPTAQADSLGGADQQAEQRQGIEECRPSTPADGRAARDAVGRPSRTASRPPSSAVLAARKNGAAPAKPA